MSRLVRRAVPDRRPPPPVAATAVEAVRRLDLTLGRQVDGLLHGDHAGRLPGLGSEAGESRRYAPGDDPRRIDWNVSARSQDPYVRDAIADREVETWLVVDLTASTDFGTARCTKRDLVVAAAGAFALLASRSGDRVGAHVLTADGIATLPARTGEPHARALLDAFGAVPRPGAPQAGVADRPDLGHALDRLARHTRRRGLAVVVSDFPGSGTWIPALRNVVARHEVVAVEVLDPRELDLPDVGTLVVTDAETGEEREVRTSDAGLRRRYAEAARAQRNGVATALRERAVDHLVLRTDREATGDLVAWLAQRPRRLSYLRRSPMGGARGGRS